MVDKSEADASKPLGNESTSSYSKDERLSLHEIKIDIMKNLKIKEDHHAMLDDMKQEHHEMLVDMTEPSEEEANYTRDCVDTDSGATDFMVMDVLLMLISIMVWSLMMMILFLDMCCACGGGADDGSADDGGADDGGAAECVDTIVATDPCGDGCAAYNNFPSGVRP